MMRFFLFIFFITSTVFSQPIQKLDYFSRQSFTHEDFEVNKIKTLKIENRKRYSAYYTKDQKLPEKKTLVEEVKFKNGLPVEKIYYDSYGRIRNRTEYKYDKMNNLITEEAYNEYDNIISRREITYNSQNDTSEVVKIFNRRSKNEKKQFLYDDQNRLITIKHFDQNDKIFLNQNFIYEKGQLKFLRITNAEDVMVNESEFFYNKAGNLTAEKQNGREKKYIYDEKNRLIKVEFGNELRVYKYNDRNYFEDDRFYLNSKRQYRLTFTYAKNGLVDEVIRYDSEDVKVFYSKFIYK